MSPLPILNRTSQIEAAFELYDSDIQKIMAGPMEWFNARTGSWRVVDDVHKGLVEQFERIGFRVDVEVWTLGECRCPSSHSAEHCPHLIPVEGAYQFGVMVTGKINGESGFDFDRQRHEIVNNLLDIPGEGGTIKFDKAAEQEFLRRHGGHPH